MNPTMEDTIVRAKAIYEQVTGVVAPDPTPNAPYARIPPEVDAEEYVTMKAASLLEKVRSIQAAGEAQAASSVSTSASASASASAPASASASAQALRKQPIPAALIRSESELRWVLEMPGVAKASIEVNLLGTAVTVSASRPAVAVERGEQVLSSDLAMGPVERTLTLPTAVEASQVQATFADGLLTVRVRMPAGTGRAQRIDVR